MAVTTPSENPFDDCYATELVSDSCENYEARKTLEFPELIAVPFIDALPPMQSYSPESSISLPSTAPSTPPTSLTPIKWTNADLHHLLSTLYPDQMIQNELDFVTCLEHLQDAGSPVSLKLYLRIPSCPIPAEAYSATAPIGTGRPVSKLLIAESLPSLSPAAARRSLAESLLADRSTVAYIAEQYNLLSALYNLPLDLLRSVRRGMLGMSQTKESERYERFEQFLDAGVDDCWCFDARLELFLLEAGGSELGRWLGAVEVALGLEKSERQCWARVYGEAGAFLGLAVHEIQVPFKRVQRARIH